MFKTFNGSGFVPEINLESGRCVYVSEEGVFLTSFFARNPQDPQKHFVRIGGVEGAIKDWTFSKLIVKDSGALLVVPTKKNWDEKIVLLRVSGEILESSGAEVFCPNPRFPQYVVIRLADEDSYAIFPHDRDGVSLRVTWEGLSFPENGFSVLGETDGLVSVEEELEKVSA